MKQHVTQKYGFIDALRGYAVLLVITCHTGGSFAELPYPVRKLTNFGWHGVQLFFLVSCVTLLMSWRSDERRGTVDAAAFWTRRFFRIAPMYYLAGLLYFVIEPPPSGFDFGQMIAAALFVNTWSPPLTPTVLDRWMVVPGGWSIGVEFSFYLVFPLLAWRIRRLRGALLLWLAAIVVGMAVNSFSAPLLRAAYGAVPTENFLYFWMFNQFPIFVLGMVLYFAIEHCRAHDGGTLTGLLRAHGAAVVAASALAIAALAEQRIYTASILTLSPLRPLPLLMLVSLLFVPIVLALSVNPGSILNNRAIRALGEVSFSAYLLHFLVLKQLPVWLPAVFDTTATGYMAIARCAALWVATVPITFALSWLAFQAIEQPMIRAGRQLLERRARARQLREA